MIVRPCGRKVRGNRGDIRDDQIQKRLIDPVGKPGPDKKISQQDRQHQQTGKHKISIPPHNAPSSSD
jgi:hypothetical protein